MEWLSLSLTVTLFTDFQMTSFLYFASLQIALSHDTKRTRTTHKHWHIFRLTDGCFHHSYHMFICDYFLEKEEISLYDTKMYYPGNTHLCNSARYMQRINESQILKWFPIRGKQGNWKQRSKFWREAHSFQQCSKQMDQPHKLIITGMACIKKKKFSSSLSA